MVIQVNKIHDAWIALGAATSPILVSLMTHIGNVAVALESWTKAHPVLAHMAAEFAIVLAVVLGLVGVLGLVAAAITAAAALLGGPFIIAAAIIAALGTGIMLEWDNVGQYFKKWGEDILYYLEHPFKALPDAIRAEGNAIKDAAKWVAHGISRFLVGHSPIPEGPLHDLNLGHHIAQTLVPPPRGTLSRVAAAFVPPSSGLGGLAPRVPTFAPPSSGLGGLAPRVPTFAPPSSGLGGLATRVPTFVPDGAFGGMRNGGGSIHISFAPRININGAGSDIRQQVMAVLRDASGELVDMVESAMMRRRRMEFS